MKNELCSLNFESFYRNRIQEKRIWYQTNFAWEKNIIHNLCSKSNYIIFISNITTNEIFAYFNGIYFAKY